MSDANRTDDEEYVVHLVGRVISVSIETIAIVAELPAVVEVEAGKALLWGGRA